MLVSYSWLAEFIPDLDVPPADLAETLSEIGLCCEEIIEVGAHLDGVVVARVAGLSPHPDADRIQLVSVDAGGDEPLQVCCGAFNMAVGDRVPFATIGTTMASGMEIARRKLRGEWSNGMLCSAPELDLPGDESGILVLDTDAPLGTPLADALGVDADTVFDLDLTPNRPDALSIIGVARDVAGRLGLRFILPDIEPAEVGAEASEAVSVTIEDPELCGRFTLRVLDNVPQGPSPRWMQQRLSNSGMRPISAVVDASNYVMLEYGQPNHTYDLATVPDGRFAVRRARDAETIDTLDGQTRTLRTRDGVIVDADDNPIGLAGVMGGAHTEISETTSSVALELAWWDPVSISITSKELGLRSEASARFEKGVDPDVAPRAARRFAQLLGAQGATLRPGLVVAEGRIPVSPEVRVRTARVNELLGTDLTTAEIRALIEPIGFVCADGPTADVSIVTVPTWRPDSDSEIDIVEEVARLYGYARLGSRVPKSPLPGGLSDRQKDLRKVRSLLMGARCTEILPMPFLAPGDLQRCGVRTDSVAVANPLVAEESILRTSLLPGMVKTLGYNAAHRAGAVRLFEVGRCFAAGGDDGVPLEWDELAVALSGHDAEAAVDLAWVLLRSFAVSDVRITNEEIGGLHPGRSARISAATGSIGVVGEIDPGVADAYGVGERVAYLSFTVGGDAPWHGGPGLLSAARDDSVYRPISRFPSSDFDVAFLVPDAIGADAVAVTIAEAAGELLVDHFLFDVYRSEGSDGAGRSLAYRLRLQADDRTLTDAEVAAVRDRVIDAVQSTHGATLRG